MDDKNYQAIDEFLKLQGMENVEEVLKGHYRQAFSNEDVLFVLSIMSVGGTLSE